MGASTLGLDDTLQTYLLKVSLHEPRACQRLREYTETLSQAMMISSPEQVQMLLLLFKLQDAGKGLEIGTFTGYTTWYAGITNDLLRCQRRVHRHCA